MRGHKGKGTSSLLKIPPKERYFRPQRDDIILERETSATKETKPLKERYFLATLRDEDDTSLLKEMTTLAYLRDDDTSLLKEMTTLAYLRDDH